MPARPHLSPIDSRAVPTVVLVTIIHKMRTTATYLTDALIREAQTCSLERGWVFSNGTQPFGGGRPESGDQRWGWVYDACHVWR
jgi:hypothetical protein